MLADVFPERNQPPPLSWRRSAVSAAVFLLHLLLLYGLLHAVAVTRRSKTLTPEEITILFPTQRKTESEKKTEPQPLPTVNEIPPDTTAPITIPRLTTKPHSTEDDGIGRLGRYLNNCSSANYGSLTEQEWANCLGGMATQDRNGNTIKLGDVRTLWEKQHPKATPNPNEATGFGECAHDDPRRRMGLPCFQHDGDRPSILNGQQ
jgi:hypothetical protein